MDYLPLRCWILSLDEFGTNGVARIGYNKNGDPMSMAENSWQQFIQTGRVADYLKYKEEERQEGHEQYHQRVSDTGADHRGE